MEIFILTFHNLKSTNSTYKDLVLFYSHRKEIQSKSRPQPDGGVAEGHKGGSYKLLNHDVFRISHTASAFWLRFS